jgi:hypothetical protein
LFDVTPEVDQDFKVCIKGSCAVFKEPTKIIPSGGQVISLRKLGLVIMEQGKNKDSNP